MSIIHDLNVLAPGLQVSHEIIRDNDSNRLSGVAWSNRGHALALLSKSGGGGFSVWDEAEKHLEYRTVGAFAGVNCLSWSPDDTMIAVGCIDGTIQVQTSEQGSIVNQFNTSDREADGWVEDIAWLKHRPAVVSLHSDNSICLWELTEGETSHEGGPYKQYRFTSTREAYGLGLALSPEGTRAAHSAGGGPIYVFDTGTGIVRREFEEQRHLISCLAWSPNEWYLAAGSWDHAVYVWDMMTGELVKRLDEPQGRPLYLSFSPDSRLLAATSDDNVIRLWRCRDWCLMAQVPELIGGPSGGLGFHPNRTLLAAGGDGGCRIRIWEYDSYKLAR